jgi:nucleoporin NUP1
MAPPPLLLVLLSILRNRYVFSVTLFFLSLIGFISRTLPPIDLILSLSFVLRLLTVSARLCCPAFCFKSVSGLRPTNAAEIALQELERYRTPLVPTYLGLANVDVALPGLFQARKKARALVLMKRDERDDKPRLGHASKYINSSKEKDKDTQSKNKKSKPYAGEGGLKKLLARRKQEVIEAESVEDPDVQAMIDDNERELERPKRTSKIAEPVRSPATFARKVSAPPPSSFVPMTGRKPAHGRTGRARTVGPTRTRNRFTAAYEDDEPDGADDLTTMPEEPSKEKESISSSLPKFEPPSGFSFAPVRLFCLFSIAIANN